LTGPQALEILRKNAEIDPDGAEISYRKDRSIISREFANRDLFFDDRSGNVRIHLIFAQAFAALNQGQRITFLHPVAQALVHRLHNSRIRRRYIRYRILVKGDLAAELQRHIDFGWAGNLHIQVRILGLLLVQFNPSNFVRFQPFPVRPAGLLFVLIV
jgi:hypothetical protein